MRLIQTAISETGVSARLLDASERRLLLERLRDGLGADFITHRWPWDEKDSDAIGVRRYDGWQLIADYVGKRSCLMFPDEEEGIWAFRNGRDLETVIAELPALEFNVCDAEASYLLCHNHHDYLVGWGAAKAWVAAIAEQ